MPRRSGRDVAMELQQRIPALRVLFMSGYAPATDSQTGVRTGVPEPAPHFIAKPFTPADLLSRVREALATPVAGHGALPADPAPTLSVQGRVVVADDEPGLRLLLTAILSGAGYEVLQAQDGLEALRLCQHDRVDLLLTDLVMPDQEGLETIRRMRHERPDIPVVAMSGAFDGDFLEVAQALGASAVLPKPFTPDQVVEVIARVLRRTGAPR